MTHARFRTFAFLTVCVVTVWIALVSHQSLNNLLTVVGETQSKFRSTVKAPRVDSPGTSFGSISREGAFGSKTGGGFGGASKAQGAPATSDVPLSVAAEIGTMTSSDKGFSDFSALIFWKSYVRQLAFTTITAAPAALLVALLAFFMSTIESVLKFDGRSKLGNMISQPFEILPNIFWILPFATLARWLYSLQPDSDSIFLDFVISEPVQTFVSWAYQFLVYLGFGFFFLIFFYRENQRRLIEFEQVIESEKLMGSNVVSIYLSLFVNAFLKQLFFRQVAFCTLFIFLMDFAILAVINVNQAYSVATVFSESARMEREHLESDQQLQNLNRASYSRFFANMDLQTWKETPLKPVIMKVKTEPALLLSPGWRAEYNSICLKLNAKSRAECLPGNMPHEWMDLPDSQFENVYFQRVSSFYFYQNILLIFILFIVIFTVFDSKRLIDEF
jgi:hypothetical protein